jgi:hypothetical protein
MGLRVLRFWEVARRRWLGGKWSFNDGLASMGDAENKENAGIPRFLGLMLSNG